MKNVLKAASLVGSAAAISAVAMVTSAAAATPVVPGSAVYTAADGKPTATVPVYYKCTRKGCGYFFYRKYGTPVVYAPPTQQAPDILGPLLSIPGAVVNGATGVVGGVVGGVGQTTGAVLGGVGQTTGAVLPALSLGLL